MFCLQEEIAHQAQHVLTAELHLSKCSGSVKDAVQMQLTQLRAVQHGVPLLEPAFAKGTQFLHNVYNCLYGHLIPVITGVDACYVAAYVQCSWCCCLPAAAHANVTHCYTMLR